MVKIRSLELENVKRVKAVTLTPGDSGLTIIGGDNCQGKTSVLDAICFALGGEKYRRGNLQREGAVGDASIRIELDNGLIVERKGKNAALKVTDPSGKKAGQSLLDGFVEQFALDLPKFLNATAKEKGKILLNIIGVGDQLLKLEQEEQKLYNERHGIGTVADRKKKFAEEMQAFPDVPEYPVTASELIERQKSILAKNAENDRLRNNLYALRREDAEALRNLERISNEFAKAKAEADKIRKNLQVAESANIAENESTAQLEAELSKVEEINAKVRANMDKQKAKEDADAMAIEYAGLSARIENVRANRAALLNGARMPLPSLSIEDGELTMDGKKWDCMSGAQQLQAATAIVRQLKPSCGFVLLDGLEQMDGRTLAEFGAWLEGQDVQAIATRVSKGGECSIIIEDGMVLEAEPAPFFQPGKF